ncbi:hypothetical protein [Mucisphaera calidilacus]|uniref:Tetratricopeptide repeat protein n=1 Tax=Mucisphaera calidilacus TaxID=2527982 RepID=A0A518BXE7_9BACT|nr:hypothetical protein [Mucisphaera calidilacus]QDU71626.1 hypothetical protein Pan265_14780 [Mucisphaera calidilacus]
MRWLTLLILALVGWHAPAAVAQDASPAATDTTEQAPPEPTLLVGRYEVILRDGRRFECDRIRRGAHDVEILIGGAGIRFRNSQIHAIRELPSAEVEYLEQRSQLSDDDLDGRYELAYGLYEQGHRDLALRELDPLHRQFPDSHRVTVLWTLLREQIEGEERTRRLKTAAEKLNRSVPLAPAAPDLTLTPEQISLVRLWEQPQNMATSRPQIRIPREVMEDVFAAYRGHPAIPASRSEVSRLLRAPAHNQLELLFELEARDYYARVEVLNDPPAIKTFMGLIRPGYHARHFARYFGGGAVEGLPISSQGRAPTTAYADFVTLSTVNLNGHKVINRRDPEQSLYLQWGLPRELAEHPAPDVSGWRPYFRDRQDRVYQFLVTWIDSLYDFDAAVDYGFPWPPPPNEEDPPSTDPQPIGTTTP